MASRPVRWGVIALGTPFLVVALMLTVGMFLPREHVVASRARFGAPPDSVWAVVSDFPSYPEWRPDVSAMDPLPDQPGRPGWMELPSRIPYRVVAKEEPRFLATEIESGLSFRGTLRVEIEPLREGGAAVTLTEQAEVDNPVFRFLARFAFGYHSTIDGYLIALGNRLGEEVKPEHVAGD